jgi:acyl carrier protein
MSPQQENRTVAVYEELRTILVNDLQVRAEDITPTSSCVDVGLDSLTMVELASVARNRLDIEVHDYELLELGTVGDIARLMDERGTATASAPSAPRR